MVAVQSTLFKKGTGFFTELNELSLHESSQSPFAFINARGKTNCGLAT